VAKELEIQTDLLAKVVSDFVDGLLPRHEVPRQPVLLEQLDEGLVMVGKVGEYAGDGEALGRVKQTESGRKSRLESLRRSSRWRSHPPSLFFPLMIDRISLMRCCASKGWLRFSPFLKREAVSDR
jgi:hypothetical protein